MLCASWLEDYLPFGGELPSDWVKTPLSDIANFYGGYSYKSEELGDSSVAMATIKNFNRNGGFKLDGFKEIIPSQKLKSEHTAELFETLVAHTDLTQNGEVIGNAEPLISLGGYEKIIYSMDLVKVVPKIEELSRFLLAAILQAPRFKAHCLGYVNGTTVLHLSKKALAEFSLALPPNLAVLAPLDELVSEMYRTIAIKIEENSSLLAFRNSLLPKLISGEMDVSKIKI